MDSNEMISLLSQILDEKIGMVTAYAYAKSKGYSGSADDFANDMANIGVNISAIETAINTFNNQTVPNAETAITTAGSNQVTAVNTAGQERLQNVTAEGGRQVGLVADAGSAQTEAVNAAGASQVENVNTAGTTQISNVNSAGSQQITAIQQKGEETRQSIPADYTDLGNKVSSLQSAITLSNVSGKQTFALYATFDHYGLASDGSFIPSQQYRVSCDKTTKIQFDSPTTVKAADGFKWGYIPFNGDTAGTWSGWFESAEIMPNVPFVIQIARVNEITSEIADVNEFVSALTFETSDSIALDEIKSKYMTAILGCLKNVIYESPNGAVWFNRLKALIEGYTLYDCIEINAIGWISGSTADAGIIATGLTLTTEHILQATIFYSGNSAGFLPLFGARTGANGAKRIATYVRPSDQKLGYWYSGTDTVTDITGLSANQKHTIEFKPVGMSETYPNNVTVSIDGTEYNTESTASGGILATYLGLFAVAYNDTQTSPIGANIGQKIGEVIITNRNGDIVYDLVPAFDGTHYGFLELKEYRFFYNATYPNLYLGGNW